MVAKLDTQANPDISNSMFLGKVKVLTKLTEINLTNLLGNHLQKLQKV